MQQVKKYLAIVMLLVALPFTAFIASHFVVESGKAIYNYIPQESDIVIEINTRNFISEVMYHRIYNETYFKEKIVKEEEEEFEIPDVGFDPFSSIIVFREQWSQENIWMTLMGYSDRVKFEAYLKENLPQINYCFGEEYVILQITPSQQQENLSDHMKKIMNGEIKSFKERVDLSELFDKNKEINCYIIPQNTNQNSQLISGNMSFDFLEDHIEISGEFIPVSGFSTNPPVAYMLDENAAFSLRSSLNIINSVYWFTKDKITGVPEYSQMALDYNGVNLFMVHKNLGYTIPFKEFPDMQLHFDIINHANWKTFFDTMKNQNAFKVDTVSHILSTQMGTFLQYEFNDKEFQLMRKDVNLIPSADENLYFALQFKVAPLLDNTKFAVDEQNPPSAFEQSIALMVAEEIIDELRVMANIEDIHFELRLEDETKMIADGRIQMQNKEGNSMIESIYFGGAVVLFITSYLSDATAN